MRSFPLSCISAGIDLLANHPRSTSAIADHNVRSLTAGTIIQFERKGFYIVDRAAGADAPAELILIPDGKASSIALKWKDPNAKPEAPAAAAAAKGGKKAKAAEGKKAPAAAQQQQQRVGLPELAPQEPVDSVLKSEGTKGYDIPVKVRSLPLR